MSQLDPSAYFSAVDELIEHLHAAEPAWRWTTERSVHSRPFTGVPTGPGGTPRRASTAVTRDGLAGGLLLCGGLRQGTGWVVVRWGHRAPPSEVHQVDDPRVGVGEREVEILRVYNANFQVYGARKIWRQLRREGITVARCTVERLMRVLGIAGVVRGARRRTTIAGPANPVPPDLLKRDFTAAAPNTRWVADFTEVSTYA